MYEGYWGLREKPFRKTPDPRYLFLNETYEEALERLALRGRGDGARAAHRRGGLGQDAPHPRPRRPGGRALRGGDDPEPAPLAPPVPADDRQRARDRGAALPLERAARPDPRPAARARRAGPRRAPDRRRGPPDPRQAHLRGDPPAHQLPARRPQPDRGRARGAARAARAAAAPDLPRPDPADRGLLRPRAPRASTTPAPTWPTGWRWRGASGGCSPRTRSCGFTRPPGASPAS